MERKISLAIAMALMCAFADRCAGIGDQPLEDAQLEARRNQCVNYINEVLNSGIIDKLETLEER